MREEQLVGKHGQNLAASSLSQIGIEMVEQIGTPVKLIPVSSQRRDVFRVVFGEKVSGDHRGILYGGRSVLAETKTILDRNLRYSDLREHQPGRLSSHATFGGLSLLVWVHNSGVFIMEWPIEGFMEGKSISPDRARDWVGALDVQDVLIENVPEFQTWGPLHRKHSDGCKPEDGKCSLKSCVFSKPIKKRKGEYFYRFIRKMEAHGYQAKWRVLNAADYGDATTRKRLFIIARKGMAVQFPEPTHGKTSVDLFRNILGWRAAREIIDWDMKGESIFKRKKPLSENTMRRIMAGLKKFGGKAFVIGQQSQATPRDVDQPIPTVAGAGAIAFVEPFLVTTNWTKTNRSPARSLDQPIPTITGTPQIGLAQPFLVSLEHTNANGKQVRSVDEPVSTITGRGQFGLVEPFLVKMYGTGEPCSNLENPLPTITTGRNRFYLAEPFIVEYHGGKDADKRTRSIHEPLPTQTTENRFGLVEPFILPLEGIHKGNAPRSINEPLPTIVAGRGGGHLVQPFLVEYYGTGAASSVDEPLKTQTGKDRFGLVEPMLVKGEDGTVYSLDILFRMLHPHELAGAMSFPKDYQFKGNREQVVKQIGNAVPVELAYALCKYLLKTRQVIQ